MKKLITEILPAFLTAVVILFLGIPVVTTFVEWCARVYCAHGITLFCGQ